MSGKRRRRLSQDDHALWRRVTRDAIPLAPDRPNPIDDLPKSVAPKTPDERPGPDPLPRFRIGELSSDTSLGHDLAGPLRKRVESQPLRMDRKRYAQIRKGKHKPEARLDLHGMTLDRAHPALIRFVSDSHAKGRRLVLVITGKGRHRDDGDPVPARMGVLRHQLPHWLTTPPLSPMVLQFMPAHQRHGGDGAWYVYLRRSGQ